MFGGNWFANQALLTPHASNKKEAMVRLESTGGDRMDLSVTLDAVSSWSGPTSVVVPLLMSVSEPVVVLENA